MAGLSAQAIAKSYPAPNGEELVVLIDATFELAPGESLAIVGPSGSGKSTLLSILGTLDRPTSGALRLDGTDPFGLSEPELAAFRSREVGFVFQDHHLLPQCTVLENVLVPLLADRAAAPSDVERAKVLLARVGLGRRLTHRPAQLSGGERQRAAIARALIRGPALLLADEPTGNLDRTTAASVVDLLVDLHAETTTILIAATHSPALAERMARRMELDSGRLVYIA